MQLKKFVIPVLLFFIFSSFPLVILAQNNSTSPQRAVSLNKDEVINHDYFNAGNIVSLDGTVNGDVYVAGGQVEVNGDVNGDLLVAGGQVDIRGKVSQNVRALGGNVRIEGEVGRNASVVGGNIVLEKDAKLGGNLASAGGNIEILSPVHDLSLAGGNARIESDILGNVLAGVGILDISGNSKIDGNLEYWSKNEANISPQATISGQTTYHKVETKTEDEFNQQAQRASKFALGGISVLSFISALIFGILFIKLLPVYTQSTAQLISKKFWQTLLIGFITVIITPILFILLLITIIGIPFAFIVLFSYFLLLYLAKLFTILFVGQYISKKANWKLSTSWIFVLTLAAYYIVGLIPILGFFIGTILTCCGIGAILIQKRLYYQSLRNKKLI